MRDCTGGDDNTIGCCYSKHHHAIASTMVVRRLKRNFSWVASGLLALSLASILVSLTGLWSVEHGSSGRGDRLSRVLPTRTGSTHQKQDDANFYDSATHSKEKQKQAAAAVEARAAAYRQSQHQKGAPPPRPFPRWGDTAADEETHGLALPPVLDFILHSSAHAYSPKWRSPEQRGRNPEQYTRTTDHARDMNFWFPENLYVVDADGLWTSGLHRNVTRGGKGSVKDKLVPVEAMEALWRILLLRDDPDDGDDKWPRLRQLLVRNKDDKDDDNNSAVGFPYLGWFGDFTGCNYRNWKKEEDEQQQYYSIPLFTTAARVDCNYAFPFPNYQTIKDSQNTTQQWHQLMRQYAADYPWSAKRPQVVWRGSLTGEIYNATTKNARWRMVQKVTELRRDYEQQQQQNRQNHHHNQQQQQHPFLFDVGTTRLPRRHDRWELNLTEVGGILGNDQRISPKEDFQRYRGILDVDGNSWSARFGALLCYNSVILKVDPTFVDYFYFKHNIDDEPALQPWKHYIPVAADLSDLVERAAFVTDPANDGVLQTIVANANAWCRENMIRDRVTRDMLDIWERYVELLDRGSGPHWVERLWRPAKEQIFAKDSRLDMILLSATASSSKVASSTAAEG